MDPQESARKLYEICFAFASANKGYFPKTLDELTPRFTTEYIPTRYSNGCTLHYIAGQGTISKPGRVLFFTDRAVEASHFLTMTVDGKEELMCEADLRQKLANQQQQPHATKPPAQPPAPQQVPQQPAPTAQG